MRRNVVHNQFRTHKDQDTIGDEQILVAVRRIELTQFAIVNAPQNRRLPWVDKQFLQFRKAVRVSCPGWKIMVISQPSNCAKKECVLVAKVIALGHVIEVRHANSLRGNDSRNGAAATDL